MSDVLVGPAANVSDFVKTSAYGACAGWDAKLPSAPLCDTLQPAYQGKISLFGGANGDGAAPGPSRRGQKLLLLAGVSLYSSDGPNYAPASPEGAVVGPVGGYDNNSLIRSLAQLLRDARVGAPDSCTRAPREGCACR